MLYGMIFKQVVLFSKFFFYDPVIADCYLHVPQEELLLFILRIGINFEEMFFQQDGA
jgi:hypothetical protein